VLNLVTSQGHFPSCGPDQPCYATDEGSAFEEVSASEEISASASDKVSASAELSDDGNHRLDISVPI
jgi:hypothetical protein